MKLKRIVSLLLAFGFALPLAACGETPAREAQGQAAAYRLAAAVYPDAAPYPDESAHLKPNGELDNAFFDAFDAWSQDARGRRAAELGDTAGPEAFAARGMAQFLAGEPGENRVCSPLNVYLALAMLAELTDGESRAQLLALLGAEDMDALRAQADAFWNANYINDGATASILASSLWLQKGVPFRQETLDALAARSHASSYAGEMGSEAFNAALREWLNEQTGGLLAEQASGVELNADTILALATTVYFRAKWRSEFMESFTKTGVFHGARGDSSAEFMHQGGADAYYWGERFSAVAKPLANDGAMWFLLPDEGVTPEELLQSGEAAAFLASASGGAWENSKRLIVNKSIPKFDVACDVGLIESLKALGVTDVFDPDAADFSPLTDADGVFVSQAEHAARVAIDEEGVIAAAYTVMAMTGSAMPPEDEVDFTLDRPFFFAVTGIGGVPLFAGVVNQL